MPLYNVKCIDCGEVFEESIKLEYFKDDKHLVECPKCKSSLTEVLISNPKHFKHLSWTTWRNSGSA